MKQFTMFGALGHFNFEAIDVLEVGRADATAMSGNVPVVWPRAARGARCEPVVIDRIRLVPTDQPSAVPPSRHPRGACDP